MKNMMKDSATPGKKDTRVMGGIIKRVLGKDYKRYGKIRSDSDVHQLLLTLQEYDGVRYGLVTEEYHKAANKADKRDDDTSENDMSSNGRKRKKHHEHDELVADTLALFGMPASEDYSDNVKKLCDFLHAMTHSHDD